MHVRICVPCINAKVLWLHSKWKEKNIYSNEWMNEKSQKMHMHVSQPKRIYWSLTPQLETVIIQVSTVQALSLRTNPQLDCTGSYICYQWIGPMLTLFYSGLTSILTWRCLYLLKMRTCRFYQKCWHFSDHTKFITTCNSGTLYKG